MIPRLFLIGVFVVIGSGTVWAASDNPFGFETDKHPLKYEPCLYVAPDVDQFRGFGFECTSAPRDHPDFTRYMLQYVDGVGVCMIEATAWPVPRDDFEALVTKAINHLVLKYGPELTELRDAHTFQDGSESTDYFWVPRPTKGAPAIGDVTALRLSVYLQAEKGEQANKNRILFRAYLNTMTECRLAMDQIDREEAKEAEEDELAKEHRRRAAF